MERNKPGSARTFYRKLGLRFRTLLYIRDGGLLETITVGDLAASQGDMMLYLRRDK